MSKLGWPHLTPCLVHLKGVLGCFDAFLWAGTKFGGSIPPKVTQFHALGCRAWILLCGCPHNSCREVPIPRLISESDEQECYLLRAYSHLVVLWLETRVILEVFQDPSAVPLWQHHVQHLGFLWHPETSQICESSLIALVQDLDIAQEVSTTAIVILRRSNDLRNHCCITGYT